MKKFLLAAMVLVPSLAQAADCRLTHRVEPDGRVQGDVIFELDIRPGKEEVLDCQQLEMFQGEICWEQNTNLKNLEFRLSDGKGGWRHRTTLKFSVEQTIVLPTFDFTVSHEEMFQLRCE